MTTVINVRKLANSLKSIGLVRNWSDFSVRYCQRSPVYLQSVRSSASIPQDVFHNIESHMNKDFAEYGIILSDQLTGARNILLT